MTSSSLDTERMMAFILADVKAYVQAEGASSFLKDMKLLQPETYEQLVKAVYNIEVDKKLGVLLDRECGRCGPGVADHRVDGRGPGRDSGVK